MRRTLEGNLVTLLEAEEVLGEETTLVVLDDELLRKRSGRGQL